MGMSKPKTEMKIAGLKMKNPVMTASGTFGYGEEYAPYIDLNQLGAIVVKGITLKPRHGNPVPRIAETPCGMLNAIGLQNVGLDVFVDEKMKFLRKYRVPVIVNISGDTVEEYVEIAKRLDGVPGVSGLEINISCPNIRESGLNFAQDPKMTSRIVSAVRSATKQVLIAKLSPNVTDISLIARVAEDSGADAVSLINTFPGIEIDIERRRSRLANFTGGLSGPAIRPIAVLMVWRCFKAVKIPIIGMGGIMNAEDALQFIIAGATAVAVGTASFVNPRACIEVIDGIEKYLKRHSIKDVKNLTGTLSG